MAITGAAGRSLASLLLTHLGSYPKFKFTSLFFRKSTGATVGKTELKWTDWVWHFQRRAVQGETEALTLN